MSKPHESSDAKSHVKLFIPGPIEVYPETYEALSKPLIGHRSSDFMALYARLQPKLQGLFYTQNPIYCMTSSAWGAMEAAVRNVTQKKILILSNGAFSDLWYDVALRCGKDAHQLKWDWGQPVDPEMVEKKLNEGGFDSIAFVANESSTGLMNPTEKIMAVVRKFPEVISIVDTVSNFSVVPIKQDELGIDIMLTATQKALALPPGLSLISVSKRALERSKTTPGRGMYFDLLEYQKFHEQNLTITTPAIPLFFGLEYRCDQIDKEGLENRYARHRAMNAHVMDWCESRGFPIFPGREYASVSLVCARNDKNIDLEALNKKLKADHKMVINIGYGKIKGKTFRISTMGDETVETLRELTNNLDSVLKAL